MGRTTISRTFAIFASVVVVITMTGPSADAYNSWVNEYRRWPWYAGTSRQLTSLPCGVGSPNHCGKANPWAIDAGMPENTAVYSIATGAYHANGFQSCAGEWLMMSDPDGTFYTYEHLNYIDISSGAGVVQGQAIAHSGNTGSCTTGPHLHFQRGLSGSDPFGTGTKITPIAGYLEEQLQTIYYSSDNAGIGYSGGTREQKIVDRWYSSGGYNGSGVTASVGSWSPCANTWWWNSCTDGSGIWGKFQTFKQGGLDFASAIGAKNSSSAAYWIPRGILGAYSSVWGGQNYLYWIGFPISNRYSVGGTLYRQLFDKGYYGYGGYITYDAVPPCPVSVYRYNGLGQSFPIGSYNYC